MTVENNATESQVADDTTKAAEAEAAAKLADETASKAAEAEAAKEAADAEAKAAEDEKSKVTDDTPLDTENWGSTNTETGDAVLRLLQNNGVTTKEAKELLLDAITAGDATKIDFAKLEAKVGKTKAELIVAGAKNYITDFTAKKTELETIAHEAVGGGENWAKLTEWARTNLPNDDLVDYIAMLNAGGRRAKLAVQDMNSRYEEAGNTSLSAATDTVVPNKDTPVPNTQEALSRKEYYERSQKLNKEGKLTPALDKALWDARQRGIKKGI